MIEAFEVPAPSIEKQRTIAGVLGSLDDKIEQNRRTSRSLERLAQAIFKAWFVDFEPVKAKAAGERSFPGMPQAVFGALPGRFVDSEIGPMPEGWKFVPLSSAVELTMGQSPPSKFYNERGDGLPFHQGVTDFGYRFPTHRVYCTTEARIANSGDVLLSVRAPVGRINIADRKLCLGRGVAGLRAKDGCMSFLYYQLRHVFAVEDAIGEGTIYKSVTKGYLESMPLLRPSMLVREFDALAKLLDARLACAERESLALAELRDYLLPKLLSGKLRATDIERAVERRL